MLFLLPPFQSIRHLKVRDVSSDVNHPKTYKRVKAKITMKLHSQVCIQGKGDDGGGGGGGGWWWVVVVAVAFLIWWRAVAHAALSLPSHHFAGIPQVYKHVVDL